MKNRFTARRLTLRQLGRCERCGTEPARPGSHLGKLCALEMQSKKILTPDQKARADKIARLERNRALFIEALDTITAKIGQLRSV